MCYLPTNSPPKLFRGGHTTQTIPVRLLLQGLIIGTGDKELHFSVLVLGLGPILPLPMWRARWRSLPSVGKNKTKTQRKAEMKDQESPDSVQVVLQLPSHSLVI